MADSSTYQFSCPSCSALLQAVLKQALTSVQCGECFDVFDVQMPAQPPGAAPVQPTITPAGQSCSAACAAADADGSAGAADAGASAEGEGDPAVKRQRTDGAEGGDPPEASASAAASASNVLADDDSAANLEASLQSCTAHRYRILAMLNEEPENRNLIELRDQLTNAINQLQGTKNMVQLARNGRPGGAMQPLDGSRPAKGHSSRKNKPQRCSVCGGIGHKSRTCSMAVTPNAQQMCQPVQWAAATAGGAMAQGMPMGAGGDPSQMYAAAAAGGGYVMVNGQQGQMMQMQPGQMANMVAMQQMPIQQQQMMQASMMAAGGMQLAPGTLIPMAAVEGAPATEPIVSAVAEGCIGTAPAAIMPTAVPTAVPAAVPTAVMPAAVPAAATDSIALEAPAVAATIAGEGDDDDDDDGDGEDGEDGDGGEA